MACRPCEQRRKEQLAELERVRAEEERKASEARNAARTTSK